jgi:hypothetical protein
MPFYNRMGIIYIQLPAGPWGNSPTATEISVHYHNIRGGGGEGWRGVVHPNKLKSIIGLETVDIIVCDNFHTHTPLYSSTVGSSTV